MTKQSFMIMAVGLVFAFSARAQDGPPRRLTLAEAQTIAMKHNHEAQIARSRVAQAGGSHLESLSGFLPHLSISESYLKSNDPVNVFMMKLKQGIFTQQDFDIAALNDPAASDNFTTTFQVQQPLVNAGAIYGKSAASLGVKATRAAARRTEQAITLNVTKAYFGLVLTREKLAAIELALRSAQAHRDNAKAAQEQGLVNQADYLAAEVRLAELQEQRISARHDMENAGDILRLMMGIEETTQIVAADSLTVPPAASAKSPNAEPGLRRADLQAMHFQRLAAGRSLGMARSGWLPNLNAFGAIEWNASSAFSDDATSWAAGLQLEWKFFDGFGHFGRSKSAAAERDIARLRYRQAEQKARLEIRKAERGVQSAQQRIAVAQVAVQQAGESLQITEARYEQGLEKTADLLGREAALTQVKLRHLKAKYDLVVAISELDFAIGE